jgi:ribosome-interacting GTPase 1
VIEIPRAADAIAIVVDVTADDMLDRLEFILQRFDKAKIGLMGVDDEEPPWPYVPRHTIMVANKMDMPDARVYLEMLEEFNKGRFAILPFSVNFSDEEIQTLKETFFNLLHVIRIYTKEPGKPPDMKQPFTVPEGSTLLDLAREIHKDFLTGLKYARIWGSTRFDGQTVQKDYILQDGDVVEFHISKVSTDY